MDFEELDGFTGCGSIHLTLCSQALDGNPSFMHGGLFYRVATLGTHRTAESLTFETDRSSWPAHIWSGGVLIVDGTPFRFADAQRPSPDVAAWNRPGPAWADGQTVSLSLRAQLTDRLESTYGWCYSRLSHDACATAISRWDQLSAQRNPITVSLDNNGRTEQRCPSTHQIRKATTSGIKCERTYAPVLPAAGALAEAWGVTEIAPPSSLRDGWDGATRSCEPQSRGYVVLTTTRWHGLNQGCHSHSAIGGAHHEHTRQNH